MRAVGNSPPLTKSSLGSIIYMEGWISMTKHIRKERGGCKCYLEWIVRT